MGGEAGQGVEAAIAAAVAEPARAGAVIFGEIDRQVAVTGLELTVQQTEVLRALEEGVVDALEAISELADGVPPRDVARILAGLGHADEVKVPSADGHSLAHGYALLGDAYGRWAVGEPALPLERAAAEAAAQLSGDAGEPA